MKLCVTLWEHCIEKKTTYRYKVSPPSLSMRNSSTLRNESQYDKFHVCFVASLQNGFESICEHQGVKVTYKITQTLTSLLGNPKDKSRISNQSIETRFKN